MPSMLCKTSLAFLSVFIASFFAAHAQVLPHAPSAEAQYCADLGNGTYRNPILKGNYADPSVVRYGQDYYMTHSSFNNYPGLLVWHSKDLVNWEPLAHALTRYVGEVWAPDLIHYKDSFYLYFPAGGTNWVVTAHDPRGPWTDPVDLKTGGIDPGHVATPDGKRYLNLAGGQQLPLADDGRSVTGPAKQVYNGWPIPQDWTVECSCLESPKVIYHNGYYYMTVAEGGTAGPPTSHMVVSARSRTPFGPWENSPRNPIVHNASRQNQWASTGHGTLIAGTGKQWWLVLHGFDKDNRTIGRQTLLLPVRWTTDGWFYVPPAADPAKPLKKPAGAALPHGLQLSDDFAGNVLGPQWNVLKLANADHFTVQDSTLTIQPTGKDIATTQPLTIMPANDAYTISAQVELSGSHADAGLVFYYNGTYNAGLSFSNGAIYGLHNGDRSRLVDNITQNNVFLKLVNDHHDLLCYYSLDGKDWKKLAYTAELSGYHHNILGGWGYFRPGVFACGDGLARFRTFRYRGLK